MIQPLLCRLTRTAALVALPAAILTTACSDSTLTSDGPPVNAIKELVSLTLSRQTLTVAVSETYPLSITMRDQDGVVVAGHTVTFRALNTTIATVSGAGIITGRAAGSTSVVAQSGTLADTLAVTVSAPPPPPGFVQVRFVGGTPSAEVMAAFTSAAIRINTLLRSNSGAYPVPIQLSAGACDETQPALSETVNGLLIIASVGPIDGPGSVLGQAGPCLVRNGSRGVPALGVMAFDEADMSLMASRNLLDGVVLHEMMHVLGIGTLWGPGQQGLVADPDGPDPLFTGTKASASYGVFAATVASLGVPVENTGGAGTRGGHWRESVFQGELMTGWAGGGMQLSSITISALGDMGYDVLAERADSYSLPTLLGARLLASNEQPIHEQIMTPIGKISPSGTIN